MLLAIDIGNTSVSLGVFDGGKLKRHCYFDVDKARDYTALEKLLKINSKKIKAVAISNVVPSLAKNFSQASQKIFGVKPFWVTPATVQMRLRVDTPKEVGADRLCNAVAAWKKFKKPAIVVDFGTATTLDIVTAKGKYGGGAILPGIHVSLKALASSCAQLPKVKIAKPKRVVGRNTIECIQAGLYHGTIGMIDHLVRSSEKEEKTKMKVIATGGLAKLIAKDSKTIEVIDPYLTLKGIYLIYAQAGNSF